jgi:hypothetical protein
MKIVALEAVHAKLDGEPCERDFVANVCVAFELVLENVEVMWVFEKNSHILLGFSCQEVRVFFVAVKISSIRAVASFGVRKALPSDTAYFMGPIRFASNTLTSRLVKFFTRSSSGRIDFNTSCLYSGNGKSSTSTRDTFSALLIMYDMQSSRICSTCL